MCTAYARDLSFRETRGLEEFKGREGPDNWNWFMGDPRRLPNSNPYRTLPIPHEGRAAGSGWGNSKVSLGRGWEALAEQSSNKRHLGILVAALVVAGGGLRERANAHACLLQLPGAEGKETQPGASPGQTPFGGGLVTLRGSWEKPGTCQCPSSDLHRDSQSF